MNDLLLILQTRFAEQSFSSADFVTVTELGTETLEELVTAGWVETEDDQQYFLSNAALEYQVKRTKEVEDTLSLGELEGRIVGALERGKEVPWGKLAVAMWVFFIFMVLYSLAQAYLA